MASRVVKLWEPRKKRVPYMKNSRMVALAVAVAILGAVIGASVAYSNAGHATAEVLPVKEEAIPIRTLSHAQEVWKGALEWCESRGVQSAINPKDRDNTPSYGGYQFKPSTLIYFAGLYDVATSTKGVMDYSVQDAVVTQMIFHRDDIDWSHQFPDCVRKLGYPPRDA